MEFKKKISKERKFTHNEKFAISSEEIIILVIGRNPFKCFKPKYLKKFIIKQKKIHINFIHFPSMLKKNDDEEHKDV